MAYRICSLFERIVLILSGSPAHTICLNINIHVPLKHFTILKSSLDGKLKWENTKVH